MRRSWLLALLCALTLFMALMIEFEFISANDFFQSQMMPIANSTETESTASHRDMSTHFFGNVTVIFTSCARWDELSLSIESFETHNTYPYINRRIVMDDCHDPRGFGAMHQHYRAKYGYEFYHTTTPLPSSNRSSGQDPKYAKNDYRSVRSLHEALVNHTSNDTQWIFATEDDWYFYRSSFIEYSFLIYNHSESLQSLSNHSVPLRFPQITFLFLRNNQFYPPHLGLYEFCGGPLFFGPVMPISHHSQSNTSTLPKFSFVVNNTGTRLHGREIEYVITQNGECYSHYSANPGLKQRESLIEILGDCLHREGVLYERCVGCGYMSRGFAMASLLDNGFVGHMGRLDRHIKMAQVRGEQKANYTVDKPLKFSVSNPLIALNDSWMLNGSDCKYIAPADWDGPRPLYVD